MYEEELVPDGDQSFITSFPESLSHSCEISHERRGVDRGQLSLAEELLEQYRLGVTVDETVLAAGADRGAESDVAAAGHGAAGRSAIVAEHRYEAGVAFTLGGLAVVEAVLAEVDLPPDDRVVAGAAVRVLGLDVDDVVCDEHGGQRADEVRVDDDGADLHEVAATLGGQPRVDTSRQVADEAAASCCGHDDLLAGSTDRDVRFERAEFGSPKFQYYIMNSQKIQSNDVLLSWVSVALRA